MHNVTCSQPASAAVKTYHTCLADQIYSCLGSRFLSTLPHIELELFCGCFFLWIFSHFLFYLILFMVISFSFICYTVASLSVDLVIVYMGFPPRYSIILTYSFKFSFLCCELLDASITNDCKSIVLKKLVHARSKILGC